jgi:four helix bundle protein
MTSIRNYRDLIVWQKSMNLVTEIYAITKAFPKEELFGLTSQIRRAAISIPSNIAEGYGRNSTGDYKRFLQITVGSLYEMQTQLEIGYNLAFISKEVFDEKFQKCIENDKMSYSLIQKIK